MTAKHSPATSLPWSEPVNYGASKFEIQGPNSRLATVDKLKDAAYIVHAANAYPKLVELLKCPPWKWPSAEALLRELGEAE